jgi:signal transduction histidine kinase
MNRVEQDGVESGWLNDPAAVREFLRIAVHDLREPLRGIRASSQLLVAIHGGSTDERAVQCMQFIAEGVDRMESLIRDIAEYLHGELRELDLTEVDLERVLAEAKRQLSAELKKNEAVLTHDPLPVVTGDFFALATVFRGLIENACKFRGEAAPRIHVGASRGVGASNGVSASHGVGADQRGPEWVFSVRDNGMGFDPAYQDQIFNPFGRLNGRQFPGSGLGLTFAKRILEQHGGRIWAESQPRPAQPAPSQPDPSQPNPSQPDRGSTFFFTLPVAE